MLVYIILSCILIQLLHSNITNLRDVRLSQWCCWSVVLVGEYCLTYQSTVVPASSGSDIPWWEDCLSTKMRATQSFHTLRHTHLVTQHHAPEDLNTCDTTCYAQLLHINIIIYSFLTGQTHWWQLQFRTVFLMFSVNA